MAAGADQAERQVVRNQHVLRLVLGAGQPLQLHHAGLAGRLHLVGERQQLDAQGCRLRGQGRPADQSLHVVVAARVHQRPGVGQAKRGSFLQGPLRQLLQPVQQQPGVAAEHPALGVQRQLPGRLVGFAGGEELFDSGLRAVLRQVPARRLHPQLAREAGLFPFQDATQEAGEQVVIAEPAVFGVQRDQEQVGLLQLVQHGLAAAAPGEGIAERRAQLVEHAGLQQEAAGVFGLPVQQVFGEKFGQVQVGAGERVDEGRAVVVPAQRQRGEIEPGDPAFGAAGQGVDVAVAEFEPALVEDVAAGFLPAEAQGVGGDLEQPAPGAQPAEIEPGHRSRGDGEGAVGGEGVQQVLDEFEHRWILDDLELVQQDGERPVPACDPLQQRRRRTAVEGLVEEGLQAFLQDPDEAVEVVVRGVQVAPQRLAALGDAMRVELLEQGGLAESGRGADQQQPWRRPADLFEQPFAADMVFACRRHRELGGRNAGCHRIDRYSAQFGCVREQRGDVTASGHTNSPAKG
ncbi:hypothetical protein D9M71_337150 [compost metagenome]